MAVALVEVADREQRLDPLLPRLADADEDPRREGDAQLAGEPHRLQPYGRALVGRAEMRPAALGEPIRCGLEHDSLRRRDLAQRRQLVTRHHARVGVRQQARLLEHEAAHAHEVLDRRRAAELGELFPRSAIAPFRLVAEGEQCLATAGRGAGARDAQHLVGGHVGALAPAGWGGERAVVANVAAELRQRDEDLRRVRDELTLALVAEAPRPLHELRQRQVREHGVRIRSVDAHVLVPVKRLDGAKSRLAESLDPAERADLVRELLAHVLTVVKEAAVGPITVVSSEPLQLNGVPRFDDRGLPWNEALAAGMEEAVSEPVVAIIAADLPLLTAEDVRALVMATPECGVAIARATDGGTNAVSMRPPGRVTTHFGEPGSAAVHERAAWTSGADAHVLDCPGLAFDVDTPEDLAKWRT